MGDLIATQAHVTFGQLIKFPDVRRSIVKSCQRPLVKEPMVSLANNATNKRTTIMECYVSIKRNSIKSVVDTGATVSIMTLSLMRKLGLKIDSPSKIIAIIADESRKRALGQIHDVPIVVIPTTLQIIDFRDDNLLLGTDWCINV